MAFTHVGTKYIKRQQDFDNFLKFRHTLIIIHVGNCKNIQVLFIIWIVSTLLHIHKLISEYIPTNKFDTNECQNLFVKKIETNQIHE